MEQKIREYLATRKYALWGRFYDLNEEGDVDAAAQFILDLLIDLGIDTQLLEEDCENPTSRLGRLFSRYLPGSIS